MPLFSSFLECKWKMGKPPCGLCLACGECAAATFMPREFPVVARATSAAATAAAIPPLCSDRNANAKEVEEKVDVQTAAPTAAAAVVSVSAGG